MNNALPALVLCILINAMPAMSSDSDSFLFSKGIEIQLSEHVADDGNKKVKWAAFLRNGTPLNSLNDNKHNQSFHIPQQYITRANTHNNPSSEHYLDIIIQVSKPYRWFNTQWMASHNIGQNRVRFGARVFFKHKLARVETWPNPSIPIISSAHYLLSQDSNQPDTIDLHMRPYEVTQEIWRIWFSNQEGPVFPYDTLDEIDGVTSHPSADAAATVGMGNVLIEYNTAAEVIQNAMHDYASSPMAFGH